MANSLLVAVVSTAQADPMTSSYRLTDLGAGNVTFSTDPNGNGVIIAPGGQSAFAFQQARTPC